MPGSCGLVQSGQSGLSCTFTVCFPVLAPPTTWLSEVGGAYLAPLQDYSVSFWRYVQLELQKRDCEVGVAIFSYCSWAWLPPIAKNNFEMMLTFICSALPRGLLPHSIASSNHRSRSSPCSGSSPQQPPNCRRFSGGESRPGTHIPPPSSTWPLNQDPNTIQISHQRCLSYVTLGPHPDEWSSLFDEPQFGSIRCALYHKMEPSHQGWCPSE